MRIALFTDAHLSFKSSVDQGRWFPGVVKLLGEGALARSFLRRCDGQVQDALTRVFYEMGEGIQDGYPPFEHLITLGDMTAGAREQGLISAHAQDEARQLLGFIRRLSGLSSNKITSVAGGHDVGYCGKIGLKGTGGPSPESFQAFEDVYGPLYGSFVIDGILFVSLCSDLLLAWDADVEGFRRRYDTQNGRFAFMAEELEKMLRMVQRALEANPDKPFVLFVHDPEGLANPGLKMVVSPHRARLIATLCGHLHARWVARLLRRVNKQVRELHQTWKVQVIPSTWGSVIPWFWWTTGSGWAELVIEGGSVELLVYRTGKGLVERISLLV